MTVFETATSCSQNKCSTRLSYTPIMVFKEKTIKTFGGPSATRTRDQRLKRPLLYRLSYGSNCITIDGAPSRNRTGKLARRILLTTIVFTTRLLCLWSGLCLHHWVSMRYYLSSIRWVIIVSTRSKRFATSLLRSALASALSVKRSPNLHLTNALFPIRRPFTSPLCLPISPSGRYYLFVIL